VRSRSTLSFRSGIIELVLGETSNMTLASNEQAAIVRTERGLTIAGTRITIYDVMDYVTEHYPSKFIRG
jgi:hypothetical protein